MLPILKYWDSWPETTTYDAYYSITQKTVDGCLEIDVEMPGVTKEEIELKYLDNEEVISIFAKGKINKYIYPRGKIDIDKIEAKLDLGILKIRVPLKNNDRIIKVQ